MIAQVNLYWFFIFSTTYYKFYPFYCCADVAYYCGNAFPWFYSNFPQLTLDGFVRQIPYVCTQKPPQCQEDHYYEEGISYPIPKLGTSFQGYGQIGY